MILNVRAGNVDGSKRTNQRAADGGRLAWKYRFGTIDAAWPRTFLISIWSNLISFRIYTLWLVGAGSGGRRHPQLMRENIEVRLL